MSQKIPLVVADLEIQLASAISVGGTSFTLSSILDDDGNTIPNGLYCFTIDNGTSAKEYLLGNVSGTSVTGVKSISRQSAETVGAVRAHRVGASVILTDFSVIKKVADVLRGSDTLDGTSPLSYDTQPSLSDGKQLATVQYVLDVVTGGTVTFSSQTIPSTAGETLVTGDVVYFKESDQKWWKADADVSATYVQVRLGVALANAAADAGVNIHLSGLAAVFSSLTPGSKYYLSNTAGGVSTSAGTTEVFLGTAVNSTTILWAPGFIYNPTAKEKEAMAGTSGTPSSANPFATKATTDLKAGIKFGGTGADGALSITSGTTTLDLAGAQVFVKNYTSISITATGQLAFSNPHANGTVIILKSQGNVTITSSATPAIDIRSLGGAAGSGSNANDGNPTVARGGGGGASSINNGAAGGGSIQNSCTGGNDGSPGIGVGRAEQGYGGASTVATSILYNKSGSGAGGLCPHSSGIIYSKFLPLTPGAGGGGGGTGSNGGGTAGNGGRGAGALYIECGGALNISGIINAAGANGTSTGGNPSGGGGGGGGTIIILYATLTANTGTYTVTGGTGGTGGTNNGGDGGLGYSLVAPNTDFV